MTLPACGQRGDLTLPKPPPGAERATLPQTLRPGDTRPAVIAPVPSNTAAPTTSPAASTPSKP